MRLENKHILLGVSGSIAAYKTPELIRFLQKQGATVQVMVTSSALHFITALTLETISGFPLLKNVFERGQEMSHVQASRKADLILIAPATAHQLAKFAYGMADDMLAATVLASKVPVLIAPAMNGAMWNNPLVQENVKKLQKAHYHLIHPDFGIMACGEYGEGRLSDLPLIVHEVCRYCTVQDLAGKTVLVTGGATREYVDPVRFLANASSGKMALSLALEAYYRGAKVVLVSGYGEVFNTILPKAITKIEAESAEAMLKSVLKYVSSSDIFIGAAAVSDYTFKKISSHKIKKEKKDFTLPLKPTVDILEKVLTLRKKPFVVGFGLESHDILQAGLRKFKRKEVDLMILNTHRALGADQAKVSFLSKKGFKHFPLLTKAEISKNIFDDIVKSF